MRTALDTSLVDLLGDTRARIAELLRAGPASVAEIAAHVEISEPAVRRHIGVLERDDLVEGTTVRRDRPGRPGSVFALTERARRLFPDRSADLANQILEFLTDRHGRPALLAYLRWRQAREADRYTDALQGVEGHEARARRLAELLSEDGYLAEAGPAVQTPDGATVLQLRQGHCAVGDVAAAHPELCAYETALFRRVLGGEVQRTKTIAGGATACVCTVSHDPPAPPVPATAGPTTHGGPDGHEG